MARYFMKHGLKIPSDQERTVDLTVGPGMVSIQTYSSGQVQSKTLLLTEGIETLIEWLTNVVVPTINISELVQDNYSSASLEGKTQLALEDITFEYSPENPFVVDLNLDTNMYKLSSRAIQYLLILLKTTQFHVKDYDDSSSANPTV